jgi:hypothetical protein
MNIVKIVKREHNYGIELLQLPSEEEIRLSQERSTDALKSSLSSGWKALLSSMRLLAI